MSITVNIVLSDALSDNLLELQLKVLKRYGLLPADPWPDPDSVVISDVVYPPPGHNGASWRGCEACAEDAKRRGYTHDNAPGGLSSWACVECGHIHDGHHTKPRRSPSPQDANG